MYWIAMGPWHGKLVFHLPSETVGVARSRIRSENSGNRIWEYSLLLATGERTPFYSEREFRRPTHDQVTSYVKRKAEIKAAAMASSASSRPGPAKR